MIKKRHSLIPLLLVIFAGGLLAGCNKNPEQDRQNEPPEVQQMRQEKKGD